MKRFSRVFAVLGVFAMSSVFLVAQTFRGGINGTVTDNSGASVAGATVTVTSPATGLTRTVQTDDQGNYFVNELPLGNYSVTVAKSGFNTQTATNVNVAVAAPQRVDVKLKPGQVAEKIEVTAEVPLVESTNDNAGGTIQAVQAENLPVNGRDFTKLLVQVPGATGDPSGAADSPGSFGLFSINGNRGRSNNYLLDGTDMNDGYRNLPAINEAGVFGTPATILPVDAIAEMPIINSGEAEYGRNSGAIVDIVTKSGTNDFHGSAYEYFRNDTLDARNFFNTAPTPQDKFNNNQFGGTLGGPIVRDKTFFFVAYEGQRENGGIPQTSTVPTQADLLNYLGRGLTVNPVIANLLMLNPWHIPANFLTTSPTGFPLSTTSVIPVTDPFRNRVDSLIAKVDQHLRNNQDLFTARYFYGNSDQSFPLGLVGGSAVPGYNTDTPTSVHVVSLSYVWVPTNRLIVEFRGGYNRFYENFLPQDRGFIPSSIGLNNGVVLPQDFGLPQFRFTPLLGGEAPPTLNDAAFSNIGATPGINRARTDQNYQFFNNYTYTFGNHNFKWGYEYRRTNVTQYFDAGYRGVLNFSDSCSVTVAPGGICPVADFTPVFDNFLAGTTAGFGSHQMAGNSQRHTFQNNNSLYFQDNWHILPRLSLNLGLRWDYFGVIGEKNNLFSLFNPVTQAAQPVSQLYPKDLNNFAPRVSVAWDTFGDGKTIVRAGWGVYYDAFSQDFFIGELPFPTFNSGPAYNFLGASNPNSIFETYSPNSALGVATGVVGPCPAGSIAVPNSPGSCAGPTFNFPTAFGAPGNDTFTVDQHIRTPYIQNYNLNVERQLGGHASVQIGYVGSTGRKLFHYIDLNQCNPALLNAGLPCHPFPSAPGFGYVLDFQSSANSQYHSLQTQFNIQNWHHLSTTVNYVYGHSIDTASDGQDYVPNASQPDNSYNPGAERASSNFDQRHRFTWNYLYEFPNPQQWKWFSNGWEIDGLTTLATGQPFNVSVIDNFCCDFNGTGEFYGRPNLIGNPFAGTGGLNILNLAAFQVPSGSPGNLGRNAFTGPSYKNFDFSVVKNTHVTERVNVQLRADFFNIFNHPNFTNPLLPNFEVDMAQNGLCAGSGDPRCPTQAAGTGIGFLQPTATPDVGIGNPFLGGGGPRNVQVALKVQF